MKSIQRAGKNAVAGRRRSIHADRAFDSFAIADVGARADIGQRIAVLVGVKVDGDVDLFQVAHAGGALGMRFGPGEDGQQDRHEDGDDSDDNQHIQRG